jgi:L-histidine N-alpha-methyltransferase
MNIAQYRKAGTPRNPCARISTQKQLAQRGHQPHTRDALEVRSGGEILHEKPVTSKAQKAEPLPDRDRLRVRVLLDDAATSELARDVRAGLARQPKSIPPKYFYDAEGSRLFDRICDTPEYYQTRTEQKLLEALADDLIARTKPSDLIELGSGAARKTRALLDAMDRAGLTSRYVPFDVSESMLCESAEQLLDAYPWLDVAGIVGDYERHLDALPAGARRLFLFLGSTIGNFGPGEAVAFLARLRALMSEGDFLLIGLDTVKSEDVLNNAYNDAQGLTEAFNKNVLRVINRELYADFDLNAFEHVAFYNHERSQIEMHLEARCTQRVRIKQLDMNVDFVENERILTEISRKFSQESANDTLERAGLELEQWFAAPDDQFALALCRPSYARPPRFARTGRPG